MKKILIIVIVVISVALVAAFGSIYFLINKANEPSEEEKLKTAQEEIDKISVKDQKGFSMDEMTIQLKKPETQSKYDYLRIKLSIYVADEETLTVMESLKDVIADTINGIFEQKTAGELEGKREEMKEPILEAVRDLFTTPEEKIKILSVYITDYKVAR